MSTLEEIVKQIAASNDKANASIDRLAEENRQYAAERRAAKLKSDEEWAELRKGFDELRVSQLKSDEGFADLRKGLDETRKNLRKTDSFFNTQWGKLVEALVNNQVVPLLQGRGIPVNQTVQRVAGKSNGHDFEFDIIAENGDSIVVIEVKTTLRPEHVPHFLNKLSNLKTWSPRYSGLKVYGAVAFLRQESEAVANAAKAGLFTMLAVGSSALITNPDDFKPKEF